MRLLKTFALLVTLVAVATTPAKARELEEGDVAYIWNPGRYMLLNYALQQTAVENETVMKSSFSVALSKGTVYYFHKKPLWGCVKIGADIRWFDTSFAKYKNPFKQYSSQWDEMGSVFGDQLEKMSDIGTYTLQVSVLGFGPNVGVAPFSFSSKRGLRPLRIGAYFHYDPTFGAYMASCDGDMEVSYGYCNMMDFGVRLTYRRIHLGVECRWGSGKFKPMDFEKLMGDGEDDEYYPEEHESPSKITRKFAATRFYIGFTF